MARADRLFLILAIVFMAIAAGTFGLVYGSNETDEFDDTPIDLTEGTNLAHSAVSRSTGPGRRENTGPKNDNDKQSADKPVEIITEEGTIVGTVLDHEGEPLAEVAVSSKMFFPYGQLNYGLIRKHQGSATTNEEGRFSIEVPTNGLHRVRFRHLAFAPHIETDVAAGADLKVQLKVGGAIKIKVTAQETGKAVAGAKITLKQHKGVWSESGVSDETGTALIYGIYVGDIYVSLQAKDFVPIKDQLVNIEQGKITELAVTMGAGRAIKGIVTNKEGEWIAKATIKVGTETVTGDDFGRFRIGGLEKKTQNIQVFAEGYLTHNRTVGLAGSRETADLKIELDKGGTLNVTVFDEKGSEVPNVEVKIFETWGGDYMYSSNDTRLKATTDENGRATISGIRRQSWSQYRIRATAKGWADTFSKKFKIKTEQKEKDFTLIMRSGGLVAGQVNGENGAPIKGVKMTLSPANVYEWNDQGQGNSKYMLTGEDGKFSFSQLSEGKYRVSATARGFATQYKQNIKVVGSASNEGVDFILKGGGIVKGSVKTEDGKPIPDARITINSNRSWGRGKTDAQGNYEITNLGEGPYTASARADGFSVDTKKKVFPVEDVLDFELRPDGYAWGQVKDKKTNKPVPRYTVNLQKQSGRGENNWRTYRSIWVRDRAGKFKIFAPDGTYRLVIVSPGHTEYKKDAVAISVTAEPEELEIKLTPGGAVEGWVKDQFGNGVSHTEIYYRAANADENTKFSRLGRTETDGYFYVNSLETGNYEFAFERRNVLPLILRSPVSVFAGELANVSLTARKPSLVRISAATEDEKRINWTQVRIYALDGQPIEMRRRGWSNKGANYELRYEKSTYINRSRVQLITGLPGGTYRITARYSNYLPFEDEFSIKDGREIEFEILFKKKPKKKKRVPSR